MKDIPVLGDVKIENNADEYIKKYWEKELLNID